MPRARSRFRPRARTLVRLDPSNAYALLGISPLASTKEIKSLLTRARSKVNRRRRTRRERVFGEEEAEMTRLSEIEAMIANDKARARYDAQHPQNILLTVQPGPADRWLDRQHRAAVVSAWITEELAPPPSSPSFLDHRLPRGLTAELTALLRPHLTDTTTTGRPADSGPRALDVSDLEALASAAEPQADTTGGEPNG